MSTIPGPIVQFQAILDMAAIRASIQKEFGQIQVTAKQAGTRIAKDTMEPLQREAKKAGDQIANSLTVQVSKLRAAFAQGLTPLREIEAEQKKIVALADKEIQRLIQKQNLTKQELTDLRRVTLERERAANAISRGVGVGVTAGTESAIALIPTAQIRQAQQAVQLLERQIGVQLPSAVNKFIASTTIIGPALSAAFKLTVALVLIDMLLKLPGLFEKLGNAIFDFGGKLKAGEDDVKKFNEVLLKNAEHLKELREEYRLIGLSGVKLFSEKLVISGEKLAEQRVKIAGLEAQISSLNAIARETITVRPTGPGAATAGGGQAITQLTSAALKAQKDIAILTASLNQAHAGLSALEQAARNATKTLGVELAEQGVKKLREELALLSMNRQLVYDFFIKLPAEEAKKKLDAVREAWGKLAEKATVKPQAIPIAGGPSEEEHRRRQEGVTATNKLNEEWLRATGQTVALINLEYERDLENFRDVARLKQLTAEERAAGELKIEQIKNARIAQEREKELQKIRSAAESLFDAMLGGARSFGDALKRTLMAAVLTPIRKLFADTVARIFGGGLGGVFGGAGGKPVTPPFAGGTIPGVTGPGQRTGTVSVPAVQATVQAPQAQAQIGTLNAEIKLATLSAKVVIFQGGGGEGGGTSFISGFFNRATGGGAGGRQQEQLGGIQKALGLGIGVGGLFAARQQGGFGGAVLGAASGVSIAKSLSQITSIGAFAGPWGMAIAAIGGALFGLFGGGETREEKIAKAIKRQTVTLPEPMAFQFSNLATLGDTLASRGYSATPGGFVSSRPSVVVQYNISAVDARSFSDFAERNAGAIDRAAALRAGGRSPLVARLQTRFNPA